MPGQAGARNYKNDLLIPIIEQIFPNSEYSWEAVVLAYQEQSREPTRRDSNDLKCHWLRNLCKGMKKPTGKPGAGGGKRSDSLVYCNRAADSGKFPFGTGGHSR